MLIRLKPLLISLAISLGVGALAGLLTGGMAQSYQTLVKPSFSPPAIIFPIVWTILYLLMGVSAYLIYQSDHQDKDKALTVYAVQLAVNFFWSFIFFNAQAYLLSFLWILLLWILIVVMIVLFYRISPTAAILQIPYLLWVSFAAFLNYMIYVLNR